VTEGHNKRPKQREIVHNKGRKGHKGSERPWLIHFMGLNKTYK
jgi:hypothetical protein